MYKPLSWKQAVPVPKSSWYAVTAFGYVELILDNQTKLWHAYHEGFKWSRVEPDVNVLKLKGKVQSKHYDQLDTFMWITPRRLGLLLVEVEKIPQLTVRQRQRLTKFLNKLMPFRRINDIAR